MGLESFAEHVCAARRGEVGRLGAWSSLVGCVCLPAHGWRPWAPVVAAFLEQLCSASEGSSSQHWRLLSRKHSRVSRCV